MHFMSFKSDTSYIVIPSQFWIKKEGLNSNSVLHNLRNMTKNLVEGISAILEKKNITKQKVFHNFIFGINNQMCLCSNRRGSAIQKIGWFV